jgi:hypothetical protein
VVGRFPGDTFAGTQISPVVEAEHVLRLEFLYDDAAALMRDGDDAGSKPVLQFGIVNNRDATADKVQAALLTRGIDVSVELFALPSIPRGVGGKVNRYELKSALEQAKPIPRSK